MGDSVVTGVGCRREVGEGPVLPRRVAEVIAQQLGVEVAWTALGETGADVPMLRDQFIPVLQREVERCAESGGRVDAVVVLCGLNDIKACFLWCQPFTRHPGSFRQALHELIDEIHEVAGHQCAVLLPAMPIDSSPRFNRFWPLSLLVHSSSDVWERQKQLEAEAGVCFMRPHTAAAAWPRSGDGFRADSRAAASYRCPTNLWPRVGP